jgi:hypothetical protein
MWRRAAVAAHVVLFAAASPIFSEQFTEAQIQASISAAIFDPAMLDYLFVTYNVSPDMKPIMAEHVEILFADPAFVDYLASEVSANQSYFLMPDGTFDPEKGRELASALAQDSFLRGLPLISAADQRAFTITATELLARMPPETCAQALDFTATSLAAQRAEIEALRGYDPAAARNYFAILRRATHAALAGTVPALPLTPSEEAIAMNAIEDQYVAITGEELMLALGDIQSGSAARRCSILLGMMLASTRVDGAVGDWAMRFMYGE